MKKILFPAIAVFFLCACSNDSPEGRRSQSSTSLIQKSITLEDLYDSMIHSASYKVLLESKNSFIQKMNFSGTIEEIDSETKILNWILQNINSTSFVDFQDAQDTWIDLKMKQKIVISENQLFFSTLYSSGKNSLYPVIHDPYEPVPNGCIDNCNLINESCEGFADEYFSAGLYYASEFLSHGDYDSAVTVAFVSFIDYTVIMNECNNNHIACLQGC